LSNNQNPALRRAVTIAVLLCVSLVCSCGPSAKTGSENVFRVNLGTEPPTLDWSLATDHVSLNVIANLMVGLTEFDDQLKPAPIIASSWKVLEGGKKIIFNLREDVFWSDGKRVEAGDFEYSWKRLLDPKVASEYAYILFDILNAEEYNQGKITDHRRMGVKAIGHRTLEVLLKQPASYFVAITTFEVTYPQRRDLVEKFGSAWTEPSRLVTNGPYLLSSWRHENEIELAPNPKFFLGKPSIEKVKMSMVNEKTTALALYEQGQLDFIDNHSIPTFEKPRLSRMPGFRRVPQLRGNYYGFITDRRPFDDVRLRRAFSMAIDRSVFPKVLHGGEQPAISWIPPGMLGHDPGIGLPYNPQEARRLLKEAGYPDGKGFPPITISYNTDEDHKIVAEAAESQCSGSAGQSGMEGLSEPAPERSTQHL
jgi:oligopeptide transport system substrate-binding protein